jgi:hypothetical protein
MSHAINGFETSPIDVSNPQYQADPSYAADKTPLWSSIPVEEDGWVRAHNAIRFEISELKRAIQAVGTATALEGWQVDAVRAWMAGHMTHIHEHHHNEDAIFNPFLRTRVNYPDKLEVDHVTLVAHMEAIEGAVAHLAVGDNLAELGKMWQRYEDLMLPHLHEEEVVGLPLARAFFTPQEIGKVVSSFISKGDPISLGSFIHCMGHKKDVNAFMSQEGIPGFVWYLPGKGFKSLRTLYRKKMVSHIDSLVAGRIVSSVHKPKVFGSSPITDENTAAQQPLSPLKRPNVAGPLTNVRVLTSH